MNDIRQFEIPYNFDKDLIDILFKFDPVGLSYHCIYCPPYRSDYVSAKYNYIHNTGQDMLLAQSMTREEYE